MTLPVLGTTMVTPPMLVAVTPMPTTVQNMMLMAVPKMDTRAVSHTMRLGASLRDRATLSSPLRGLAPSGGYPSRLRSLRSLRAPLARRLADAHRRVPARRRRRSVRRHRRDHLRVLLAPALRAALVAVLASLALAGCAGCGHRLRLGLGTARRFARCTRAGAPAEHARTSLRTAPCSSARTSAGTAASASGSVLRTTACGSVRTGRHSIAVAAPLRRLRRRRFPHRSYRRFGRPDRPGRPLVPHPTHR